MQNRNEIIQKFLNNYYEINENVLGIVFYGSSKYKTNTSSSDIDILIVTDKQENYKGVIYIDSVKIEYFERNIYSLLYKIEGLEFSYDRYLVSLFKNGEILYSKNNTIECLQDEILCKSDESKTRKKKTHPKLDEWYYYLFTLNDDTIFFDYVLHNFLEHLRRAYHEEKGYNKIPTMKSYQLYTNKEYAKEIYCVNLPKDDFTTPYLDMITGNFKEDTFANLVEKVKNIEPVIENETLFYSKNEIVYKCTTTLNCIEKVISYLKEDHPAKLHYYFIALDKIRTLYCNINSINDSIIYFGNNYSEQFLELFYKCIDDEHMEENILELFKFITEEIKIDYNNYKILEIHN